MSDKHRVSEQTALEKIRRAKRDRLKSLDLESDGWIVDSNPVVNPLPSELFELEDLEVLNLKGNRLDTIPEAITQLRNLKSLDLSYNQLSELPPSIFEHLTMLTQLKLDHNGLFTLPPTFSELTQVSYLSLDSNEFVSLPKEILALEELIELSISFNPLEVIPSWIEGFRKLQIIRLAGLRLDEVPRFVTRLESLTELILGGNNLQALPEFVFDMTGLLRLWTTSNQLTDLPRSLAKLTKLQTLGLGSNPLRAIPDVVYDLRSLVHLHLDDFMKDGRNQIREISPKILQLTNLAFLDLGKDHLITSPPAEILSVNDEGFGDIDKIRNYFSQLEQQGRDFLFEAKLLVIGEGGAGKSSLLKKIDDSTYELRDEELSTEGVDIRRWRFEMNGGRMFDVNMWDFGGQEIYHATHQFFLTKRSLYVLVADTRREDTDFYYWLNLVQLLSEGSPLLIVQNEKQDRHRELSNQLRGEFANFKESFAVNLASNRGLSDVVSAIKRHISSLPHVGTPLPRTWVKVRQALEKESRNYILLQEYFDICQQHGFTELKDKLQLSGYLHDLGVCLHFQDDPVLRNVVILKPKWGTEAVYKILDNKNVIRNKGRFAASDLETLWEDATYVNMRIELLQLMINFKLCYRIPNSQSLFIAPQLLTENQPDYLWVDTDNVISRYRYEFMPKGILTQFVVAMHTWISDGHVWKSGVVLEKDGAKAEVIESYGRREIRIRVSGRNKNELITIVAYELDRIHASYKRLKFDRLIRCQCDLCRGDADPHFYPFTVLRRFLEDGQAEIQCQKSYRMVAVMPLIHDVMIQESFAKEQRQSDKNVVFNAPIQTVVLQQSPTLTAKSLQIGGADMPGKNAWTNGLFYLTAFVIVVATFGLAGGMLPVGIFTIIVIASAVMVPIVGALQLRQDDRLSEKSFLQLIQLSLSQLPLIGKAMSHRQK